MSSQTQTGSGLNIERISPTDAQYFFGYYDKTPWSADQSKLLCGRTHQPLDKQPAAGDGLEVGYFDLAKPGRPYVSLGQTTLWNWQQGCMLQWADAQRVFFNRMTREGQPGCVMVDVATGQAVEHTSPIYALAPGARWGLTVNFGRIYAIRPGYGYAALPRPDVLSHDVDALAEDGLFHVDLQTGQRRLWVSLRDLARDVAGHTQANPCQNHKINHVQINRQGTRAAFLYRWQNATTGQRFTQMLVIDADGSNLRRVGESGMVSHYDWMSEDEICAWARQSTVGNHYLIYHTQTGGYRVLGEGILNEDGHLSFPSQGPWMLTDTYPDEAGNRHLLLWHMQRSQRYELGAFYGPLPEDMHVRCDLHPRWNRQGTAVCIDSVHEGFRGLYVMDVSAWVG